MPTVRNGQCDIKGQFYGVYQYGILQTFHIEFLYGFAFKRVIGLINNNGNYLVKMTQNTADGSTVIDYNNDGTGYIDIGVKCPSSYGFISEMAISSGKGMFPTSVASGSGTTYYCDSCTGGWNVLGGCLCFGNARDHVDSGLFTIFLTRAMADNSTGSWDTTACLSYK